MRKNEQSALNQGHLANEGTTKQEIYDKRIKRQPTGNSMICIKLNKGSVNRRLNLDKKSGDNKSFRDKHH